MAKYLAKYCRHFSYRGAIPRVEGSCARFSKSAALCEGTSADCSESKSLDDDQSWEAEVLRHEKLLNELRMKGTKPEELPFLEREQKVKDLPHVSLGRSAEFERNNSLLSETYSLLLGNCISYKNISSDNVENMDKDFIRNDVQEVLHRLHYSCDLEKAYRLHIEERKVMPSVRYLTKYQLKEEREKAMKRLIEILQMPPVMIERQECADILSNDTVLDGHDESNISFVDVSDDLSSRERFIVIREPNGVLRKANWEERDRLLQVYYPKPHRKIISPSLFNPQNLKIALSMKLHVNALDQCIVQYEPDSKEYIRIFEAVYDDIEQNKLYSLLRFTRYFGGLIFYLAKNSLLDGIILSMLNNDRLESAADCIKLFLLLHPGCQMDTAVRELTSIDSFSLVQVYIDENSSDKKRLSIALERLKDEEAGESSL